MKGMILKKIKELQCYSKKESGLNGNRTQNSLTAIDYSLCDLKAEAGC